MTQVLRFMHVAPKKMQTKKQEKTRQSQFANQRCLHRGMSIIQSEFGCR